MTKAKPRGRARDGCDAWYYILDNGGYTFRACVRKGVLSVYPQKEDIGDSVPRHAWFSSKAVYSTKIERLFVGNSPEISLTRWSGAHGAEWDGNSLLGKIDSERYVHVTSRTYEFRAPAEIVEFVSPVGGSGTVSPYAVDVSGNVLLLNMYGDEVVLEWRRTGYDHPEADYKARALITPDLGSVPPDLPMVLNFSGITRFFIGDDRYTLRYAPRAAQDFDDMKERFENKRISVCKNGTRKVLDKRDYVSLMRQFGKIIGARHLRSRTVVKRAE